MSSNSNELPHVSINPLTSIKNIKASSEAITTFRSAESIPERINGAKKAVTDLAGFIGKAKDITDKNELIALYTDCFYLYSEIEVHLAMGIWDESWFSEDENVRAMFEMERRECANLSEKLDSLGADYKPNDYVAMRLRWIFDAYGVSDKYTCAIYDFYTDAAAKADKFLMQWIERKFGIATKNNKLLTFILPVLGILVAIPFMHSHLVLAILGAIVLCVVLSVAGYLIDDSINESRVEKTKKLVNDMDNTRNKAIAVSFMEKVNFIKEKIPMQQ